MVKRVFDRRGRQNWDADRHEAEDRRLRERRSKSDRRIDQRRKGHPRPENIDQIELRIAERRVLNRRDGVEKTTDAGLRNIQAATRVEPDRLHRRTRTSISSGAALIEAICLMSSQNARWLVIINDEQQPIGILSEHDVIGAIAEHGNNALSESVFRFLTPLVR